MIAAFYENILTGAMAEGLHMSDVVMGLKDHGLNALYISDETLKTRAEEVCDVLRTTGVAVAGLHAWIDFSINPANQAYRFLIDEAVRLKTNNVLIMPGMKSSNNIVAGMNSVVRYGQARGIRVCMEPLDRLDASYNNIAGLEYFLEQIPGLYCCFDTGNLILRGENELAAFDKISEKLCAIHLKDRVWTANNSDDAGKSCADGRIVYPSPVGKGFIQIEEILRKVADIPVIVELYDYSPSHMLDGIRVSLEWVNQRTCHA